MKRFEKVLHVEYPDKSDLVRWYYELAKYLQDTPIPYGEELEVIIEKYLDEHPIAGGVTSVNGQKGDVTITPENIDALPIDGGVLTGDLAIVVNGAQILLTTTTDGQAQIVLNGENDVDARTAITASTDGHLYLAVGDKIYQVYDSGNFTPSGGGAVESVNGKTGAVRLTAQDVGALPDTYTAPVNSVNGEAGNVYVKTLYDNYPNNSFTASSDNSRGVATWEFAGSTHTLEIATDGSVTANGVKQFSKNEDFYNYQLLDTGSQLSVALNNKITFISLRPRVLFTSWTSSTTLPAGNSISFVVSNLYGTDIISMYCLYPAGINISASFSGGNATIAITNVSNAAKALQSMYIQFLLAPIDRTITFNKHD